MKRVIVWKKRKLLHEKYDWKMIQFEYDSGKSFNDIASEHNIPVASLTRGSEKKLLIPRSGSDAGKNRAIRKPNVITQATKDKTSRTVRAHLMNNTWHYSFSKTKTFTHISPSAGTVKLHGSWELEFAKYLDKNSIPWKRPTEKFPYQYIGLKRGEGNYIPDFYLPKDDLWIEIKGYETDKDRVKWKCFPHKLRVLKQNDLINEFKLDIKIY